MTWLSGIRLLPGYSVQTAPWKHWRGLIHLRWSSWRRFGSCASGSCVNSERGYCRLCSSLYLIKSESEAEEGPHPRIHFFWSPVRVPNQLDFDRPHALHIAYYSLHVLDDFSPCWASWGRQRHFNADVPSLVALGLVHQADIYDVEIEFWVLDRAESFPNGVRRGDRRAGRFCGRRHAWKIVPAQQRATSSCWQACGTS